METAAELVERAFLHVKHSVLKHDDMVVYFQFFQRHLSATHLADTFKFGLVSGLHFAFVSDRLYKRIERIPALASQLFVDAPSVVIGSAVETAERRLLDSVNQQVLKHTDAVSWPLALQHLVKPLAFHGCVERLCHAVYVVIRLRHYSLIFLS